MGNSPARQDQEISSKTVPSATSAEGENTMAAAPAVAARQSAPRCAWRASSLDLLAEAENKLLGALGLRIFDTDIGGDQHIHAVEGGNGNSELPLVMCHGYGMGVGGWHMNLPTLMARHHVFAKDWLGCGLSARPKWELEGVTETEEFFVDSLERWRKANNVEKMILCGHSLGGYLSVCYAEKYPNRVEKLVLASPVGFPEEPEGFRQTIEERPWQQRNLIKFVGWGWAKGITPGDIVRFAGPLGYKLMMGYSHRRFHTDAEFDRDAMGDYLYHNVASTHGSGERALSQLLKPGAWAFSPLLHRLPKIDQSIPVYFLFGDRDWMDSTAPTKLKADAEAMATGQRITIEEVPNAGHQLFLDNPQGFNAALLRICEDKVAVEGGIASR